MRNTKFFTVPYDVRNTVEMRYLRHKCGGIAAFGRWMALLSILYEQNGALDLDNEAMHKVVEAELELNAQKLDEFIEAASEIGWVDAQMWHSSRHVISEGVLDQLNYRKTMKKRGEKGNESRAS